MRIYYLAAAFAATVAAPAFAGTFHAEVHGGWDRVSVSGFKDDGIAYGVAAGYDIALGEKAFIGVEGSVDDSSTKKCVSDVLVLGDRTCASAGRDLSAVARIGYKLNETSKIYALAGYANGRVKVSYNDGVSTSSAGANGDGVRLGAGLQMGLGSHLYAKGEYRYTNYESDFSRHQVLMGLGYEF
jgi:outer membrane immunogenic protein